MVSGIVIVDQSTYAEATETGKQLKAYTKEVKDFFKDLKDSAYRTWQIAIKKEKDALGPVELYIKSINDKRTTYQIAQENKAAIEQEKATAKAEQEAAKKRKSLDARIERAEAGGNEERAEELREQKDEVIAHVPIVGRGVDKIEGATSQDDIEITIINVEEFVRHLSNMCASESALDSMITWKMGGIKKFLKAMGKDQEGRFAGLMIEKTKIQSLKV